MGFSYNVYVGPFVRCTYHLMDKPESIRSCDNQECVRRGIRSFDAFCPACASPIKSVEIPRRVPSVSPLDVLAVAGLGDNLFECHGQGCDDESLEHWFTPNQRRNEPRDFEIRRDSKLGIILTPNATAIANEIAWLDGAFDEEIQVLEKAYDNVEVTWGIIHYAI